jgi:hypothetical protein
MGRKRKKEKPLYAIDTPMSCRPTKKNSRGNYPLDTRNFEGFVDYANAWEYQLKNKSQLDGHNFYKSNEWIKSKNEFLQNKNLICCKCGSSENIQVDHILPIRRYWKYRLCKNNFQLLCGLCNKKKGNIVEKFNGEFIELLNKELRQKTIRGTIIL